MQKSQHQARDLFFADVEKTYKHITTRVKVIEQERIQEEETLKKEGEDRVLSATQEDGSYALPIFTEKDKERSNVFAEMPKDLQRAFLLQGLLFNKRCGCN